MRDILLSDFMPGGYTQAISVGLESLISEAYKPHSTHNVIEKLVREVAMRSLCLVAACFTLCANVIMGLPYLAIALVKCIQNRSDSPDLFDGILRTTLLAIGVLGMGILAPLGGAVISPVPFYKHGPRDLDDIESAGFTLAVVNILNFAIFVQTLPELYDRIRSSFGMHLHELRDTLNLEGWRNESTSSFASEAFNMSYDRAYQARNGCDDDLAQLSGEIGRVLLRRALYN